jgi:hemolysin III
MRRNLAPHRGGYYSPAEEVAHAVTHGIGCLAAVVGLVVLVMQAAARGETWEIVGAAIFGATLVLLYLASTLYHAVTAPRAKAVLKRIDHAAIYLLIAGTYTPICLGPLRGPWGWWLLGVVWLLGLTGLVLDVATARRFKWLSITIYLLMGWLVIVALRPLLTIFDRTTLLWMAAGGIFYTGGVAFYLWKSLPWNHAIWHVFVVLGSASLWVAVQRALAA